MLKQLSKRNMRLRLILFPALMLGTHGFSQQTTSSRNIQTEINSVQKSEAPREISTNTKMKETLPDSLKDESIAHLDYCISAIDQKVSLVSLDPIQKEQAEKDFWFEKMAAYRARYVSCKEILIKYQSQQ
jgi:hypothetical protein